MHLFDSQVEPNIFGREKVRHAQLIKAISIDLCSGNKNALLFSSKALMIIGD